MTNYDSPRRQTTLVSEEIPNSLNTAKFAYIILIDGNTGGSSIVSDFETKVGVICIIVGTCCYYSGTLTLLF